ncbi:hypothetical protein V1264_019849 [Littorina saxatilis]|uniref:SRCR domain-containing protein n=1 Tax=Littorina saxatilis TaxID=31220 RepID=A0AAN9BBC1_9CAEN
MKTLLLVLWGSLVLVDGKLSGGTNEYEGRVEYIFEGTRYSICADGWDDKDAQVVCRYEGYGTSNAKALTNGEFGSPSATTIFFAAIFKCDGDEQHLGDCEISSASTCNSGIISAVRCGKPAAGVPAANKPSQTAQSSNAGVQVVRGGVPPTIKPSQTAQSSNAGVQVVRAGASLLLPLCLGVLCAYVSSP